MEKFSNKPKRGRGRPRKYDLDGAPSSMSRRSAQNCVNAARAVSILGQHGEKFSKLIKQGRHLTLLAEIGRLTPENMVRAATLFCQHGWKANRIISEARSIRVCKNLDELNNRKAAAWLDLARQVISAGLNFHQNRGMTRADVRKALNEALDRFQD